MPELITKIAAQVEAEIQEAAATAKEVASTLAALRNPEDKQQAVAARQRANADDAIAVILKSLHKK